MRDRSHCLIDLALPTTAHTKSRTDQKDIKIMTDTAVENETGTENPEDLEGSEETSETEGTEETSNPAEVLANHTDDTVRALFSKVQADMPALEELHSKIKKSAPPTAGEIEKEISESEDDELVKIRTQVEKLRKQIENQMQKAREYVLSGTETSVSEDELKAYKDEFNDLSTRVRETLKLVSKVSKALGYADAEKATEDFKVPSLRGVAGSTPARTDGGTVRPQVSRIQIRRADGTPLKDFTGDKARLSVAAQYMKGITASDIVGPWLAAAGVDDWHKVAEDVTFTVGDYELTISPKA